MSDRSGPSRDHRAHVPLQASVQEGYYDPNSTGNGSGYSTYSYGYQSTEGNSHVSHNANYYNPYSTSYSTNSAFNQPQNSSTQSAAHYYSAADYANYYNAQNAAALTTNTETKVSESKTKDKKAILRAAGGQVWKDESLADWPDNDFRIFVGDLGNDVTDELLTAAFRSYPSFFRARVVRDKRTSKPRGYGFVSFKDPHDGVNAMKEMNGRFIGSRPIKLRRSTWKDRVVDSKAMRHMKKDNKIVKLRPGEI